MQFSLMVLVVAFLFNFAWEVLQMPLYKVDGYNLQSLAFCALAAVSDAMMVLLLYYGFALIYRAPLWVQSLTILQIAALIVVGGAGAILTEIILTSKGS